MPSLHPDSARYLELTIAQGHPDASEVPMEEARRNDLWLLDYVGDPEPVAEKGEISVPGPGGDIRVWSYRPDIPGPLPVLCYFHGGGWAVGGLEYVDSLCRSLANRAGCLVLSVDYRLVPEHRFPAGLEDCFAVTEWAGGHAAELGGDPTRIAVGGESAGGNLATAVSLLARERGGPEISYQLLLYQTVDPAADGASFEENAETGVSAEEIRWFWDEYLGGVSSEEPLAAVIHADLTGLPPAYVLSCSADTLCDEAEAFAELLRAANVETTSRRMEGHIHGVITVPAIVADVDPTIDEMAALLRAAFAKKIEAAS